MNRYILNDLNEWQEGFWSLLIDCHKCQSYYNDEMIMDKSIRKSTLSVLEYQARYNNYNNTFDDLPISFNNMGIWIFLAEEMNYCSLYYCVGCTKMICNHKFNILSSQSQIGFISINQSVDSSNYYICQDCFLSNKYSYLPQRFQWDASIELNFVRKMLNV